MVESAPIAALLGALLAAAPAANAQAQDIKGLTLKSSPQRAADERTSEARRIDLLRHRDDPFEQPPVLFGIPLTGDANAPNRERGFSFSVRPVKGVRAVARLRF